MTAKKKAPTPEEEVITALDNMIKMAWHAPLDRCGGLTQEHIDNASRVLHRLKTKPVQQ